MIRFAQAGVRVLPLLGLALVCACRDKGPDDAQVLAQSHKLVKPLPGLYRSTTRLTGFELPGADPQTADAMRDRFGQVLPQTRETCLTPAEAARGFQGLIAQAQQGDCRIERFVANATRLSATMSCRAADKGVSTVTVEGTAAPDRSHIELEIAQTGATIPGSRETISLVVDNRRLGDCPGGNPHG